jgi:hypothetical protein
MRHCVAAVAIDIAEAREKELAPRAPDKRRPSPDPQGCFWPRLMAFGTVVPVRLTSAKRAWFRSQVTSGFCGLLYVPWAEWRAVAVLV